MSVNTKSINKDIIKLQEKIEINKLKIKEIDNQLKKSNKLNSEKLIKEKNNLTESNRKLNIRIISFKKFISQTNSNTAIPETPESPPIAHIKYTSPSPLETPNSTLNNGVTPRMLNFNNKLQHTLKNIKSTQRFPRHTFEEEIINNTLNNIYNLKIGETIRYKCLDTQETQQITIESKYVVAIPEADHKTYNNSFNGDAVLPIIITEFKEIKDLKYNILTLFTYKDAKYILLSYGVYGNDNGNFVSIPDVRLYLWGEVKVTGGRTRRKRRTPKRTRTRTYKKKVYNRNGTTSRNGTKRRSRFSKHR